MIDISAVSDLNYHGFRKDIIDKHRVREHPVQERIIFEKALNHRICNERIQLILKYVSRNLLGNERIIACHQRINDISGESKILKFVLEFFVCKELLHYLVIE